MLVFKYLLTLLVAVQELNNLSDDYKFDASISIQKERIEPVSTECAQSKSINISKSKKLLTFMLIMQTVSVLSKRKAST